MSEIQDRAVAAAEAMARAVDESARRETEWRARYEAAERDRDALLKAARDRQLDLHAASVDATDRLAVATLAAAVMARSDFVDAATAVTMARRALAVPAVREAPDGR